MKKNIITLLLVIVSITSKGQIKEFAPIGATWHYAVQVLLPYEAYGYDKYEVVGDTIIDTLPLRVIAKSYTNINGIETDYGLQFVYQSSSTVYSYTKEDGLKLVYDFNLNEGDTLDVDLMSHEMCDSVSPVVVESVEYIDIDGEMLKEQTLKSTYWFANTYGGGYNDFFYIAREKIGGNQRPLERPICSTESYEGNIFLRCYSDESINYNPESVTCDTLITSIIEHTRIAPDVLVYPNPANEIVYIDTDNNSNISSIELLNSFGQVVLSQTECSSVSLIGYKSGFYFIRITLTDGIQKIVKITKI